MTTEAMLAFMAGAISGLVVLVCVLFYELVRTSRRLGHAEGRLRQLDPPSGQVDLVAMLSGPGIPWPASEAVDDA